jgi:hypothetical protein
MFRNVIQVYIISKDRISCIEEKKITSLSLAD